MVCRELAGALLCVLIAVDGLAPGAVVDGWNPMQVAAMAIPCL